MRSAASIASALLEDDEEFSRADVLRMAEPDLERAGAHWWNRAGQSTEDKLALTHEVWLKRMGFSRSVDGNPDDQTGEYEGAEYFSKQSVVNGWLIFMALNVITPGRPGYTGNFPYAQLTVDVLDPKSFKRGYHWFYPMPLKTLPKRLPEIEAELPNKLGVYRPR